MATDGTDSVNTNNNQEPSFDKTSAGTPERTVKVRLANGDTVTQPLPPLPMIQPPPGTTTKSAVIRWYHALGYSVSEIHKGTGIKYQMVRNIVTTTPKRAAREDMPQLVVTYKPELDELQDALDGALDASLAKERAVRKQSEKEDRRALRSGEED